MSWVVVSMVTVTVGVSSMLGNSCWQLLSTSTEVISSVEGPSSGRGLATSSFEVPGSQGKGMLTSAEGSSVDGPVGGSRFEGSSLSTPGGDPLSGETEWRDCLGLLVEEGGQGAGASTRWTCSWLISWGGQVVVGLIRLSD